MFLSYVFAAILVVIFYGDWRARKQLEQNRHTTLRLSFPKKNTEADLRTSQELIERAVELGIPLSLEYGVHGFSEHITLHLSTTGKYRKKLLKLIRSLWPTMEAKEHGNQDFWLDTNGHVSALNFSQGKSFILPLKQPKSADFSPFQAILRELSKLQTVDEGVMIQFVVRKAHARAHDTLRDAVDALSRGGFDDFKKFFDSKSLISRKSLDLVEKKASRPLFEVHGRILIAASSRARTKKIEEGFRKTVEQSTNISPSFNHIELKKIVNDKQELQGFYRRDVVKKPMLLSSNELSLLVHISS